MPTVGELTSRIGVEGASGFVSATERSAKVLDRLHDASRRVARGMTDVTRGFASVDRQMRLIHLGTGRAVSAIEVFNRIGIQTTDQIRDQVAAYMRLIEAADGDAVATQRLTERTVQLLQMLEQAGVQLTRNEAAFRQQAMTQRGVSESMRQSQFAAVNLGRAIEDGAFLLVDFRMGAMALSNNLPMLVQSLQQLKAAAAATNVTLGSALLQTLKGPGGVLLAVSALSAAMVALPALFSRTKAGADAVARSLKDMVSIDLAPRGTGLEVNLGNINQAIEAARRARAEVEQDLARLGRTTFQLNFGGTITALSDPAQGRFLVKVREQLDDLIETLEAGGNEAMASSEAFERLRKAMDVRRPPIIDAFEQVEKAIDRLRRKADRMAPLLLGGSTFFTGAELDEGRRASSQEARRRRRLDELPLRRLPRPPSGPGIIRSRALPGPEALSPLETSLKKLRLEVKATFEQSVVRGIEGFSAGIGEAAGNVLFLERRLSKARLRLEQLNLQDAEKELRGAFKAGLISAERLNAELAVLTEERKALEEEAALHSADVFERFFARLRLGWRSMVDFVRNILRRMVADVAAAFAKVGVAELLKGLFPGSGFITRVVGALTGGLVSRTALAAPGAGGLGLGAPVLTAPAPRAPVVVQPVIRVTGPPSVLSMLRFDLEQNASLRR